MEWSKDDSPLWAEYRKNPTVESRNAIIEHHMPMALKNAKEAYDRYRFTGCEFDEFLAWADIGLLMAAEGYDETRHQNKFSTYAWVCVRSQIARGIQGERGHNGGKGAFRDGMLSVNDEITPSRQGYSNATDIADELDYVMSPVPEREREYARLIYGLGVTSRKIAKEDGLSGQRVRQLAKKAIERARRHVYLTNYES